MNNIIGLSGVARSGKDFFFSNFSKITKKNVIRFALADDLKKELYSSIKNTFNIDVFNCSKEEKEKIRPILVSHAKIRRTETQGRYWIDKISNKVKAAAENKNNIIMITDVRYDEYAQDEADWIKKELGGFLIHISKSVKNSKDDSLHFLSPANEEEAMNEPKLKKKANYLLVWPDGIESEKAQERCREVFSFFRVAKIYDSLTNKSQNNDESNEYSEESERAKDQKYHPLAQSSWQS